MNRKRLSGGNVALRLLARETAGAPAAAVVPQNRRWFESIVPSTALRGIAPPPGSCIVRFTPCGRFLVSFDALRNEVVLHSFKGINVPGIGPSEAGPPTPPRPSTAPAPPQQPQVADPLRPEHPYIPEPDRGVIRALQERRAAQASDAAHGPAGPRPLERPSVSFDDAFALHARCAVATGPEEQLFAFCLAVHDDLLILASSTPDARPLDGEAGGAGWLGVSEAVTFHLLNMISGKVMDRLVLRADSAHLTHPGAVSLAGGRMTVVAPGQQAVYVVEVRPEGRLELVSTLGRGCAGDDAAVAAAQEAAEVAWREGRNSEEMDVDGGAVAMDVEGRGGAAGVVAPVPPPPQQQAQQPSPLIEGLKQRLMAYLYLDALERNKSAAAARAALPPAACGTRSAFPLEHFFYFFNSYIEMEIQGALAIDEERLLISWAPPPPRHRGPPPHLYSRGLHMIFNLENTAAERVFEGNSPEFIDWCAENPATALGGAPCNPWEQALLPGLWAQHMRRRASQDAGGRGAAGPAGCQQLQASPYLDPEIFQYDDRAMTRDLVPRPPLQRPAKFVARAWPERLRFKFEPEDVMGAAGAAGGAAPGGGGGGVELVFVFHPAAPFAMAVVENTETGLAEEVAFFNHCS